MSHGSFHVVRSFTGTCVVYSGQAVNSPARGERTKKPQVNGFSFPEKPTAMLRSQLRPDEGVHLRLPLTNICCRWQRLVHSRPNETHPFGRLASVTGGEPFVYRQAEEEFVVTNIDRRRMLCSAASGAALMLGTQAGATSFSDSKRKFTMNSAEVYENGRWSIWCLNTVPTNFNEILGTFHALKLWITCFAFRIMLAFL